MEEFEILGNSLDESPKPESILSNYLPQDVYLPFALPELDFQIKLLIALLMWLTINLIGIHLAWKKYGESLSTIYSEKNEEDQKLVTSEDILHYKLISLKKSKKENKNQ